VTVPEPVDWAVAQRLGQKIAGRDPLEKSYLAASMPADFSEITIRAEELVAEFTGLHPPGSPAPAKVLDRQAWIEANVASFRRTLEPYTTKIAERMAQSSFAPVGRRAAGAEVGLLLGFLAQRVLGQYDLLGAEDLAGDDDAIYYVGPNILGLEKRFGFRPRDFRMWIALHEVTHRIQFRGVPWMKEYFLGLVEESLSMIEPNPRRLMQALERAAASARKGRNPLDESGGIVGLFATDEQRALIDRIQALMSILEGHANFVMDHVGVEHVTGQARMSAVLSARRQSGGAGKQFRKLIGLDMKMRQYETGQQFINEVDERHGRVAVDALWQGPESLPTLAELEDPDRWAARVGARAL
jgi:coenzyme F420 biosynthesis associated uncharacterized protein